MGKQGPCYHCGVTSTPLWRNGPPEKPVLCNACGSRWRTKGTLVNYTPLHARGEGDEIEDDRAPRTGMPLIKKIPKRKSYQESFTSNLEFKKKYLDEEASNRSSSGSVVSNSESCEQSNVWDMSLPCKRRTCVGRPKAASSSVEKLRKDLYSIYQEQQSSCLSGTSEEDLIFENKAPMLIGHGSVLMRDPHLSAHEEESEASSLSSIHSVNFGGKAIKQEQLKRNESQALGRHSSPLSSIDLKEQKKGIEHSVTTKSRVSNPNQSKNISLVTIERPCESLNQNFSETRVVMRSPKRIKTEEILENNVSFFIPMSYAGSVEYEDNDVSDQDLLLDVPSNGSFPEAELLQVI